MDIIQLSEARLRRQFEIADKLALEVGQLIQGNPDLQPHDVLFACMMVIGDVVASIQCQDCRKDSGKAVEQQLPDVLKHGLAQPIQPDQQHVH